MTTYLEIKNKKGKVILKVNLEGKTEAQKQQFKTKEENKFGKTKYDYTIKNV